MTAATRDTPDEFRHAVAQCLPALAWAGGFSGAVNLLYLSSPLYLMQIYERVLPSGSMPTLVLLTLALAVALATMAALDAIRARVLIRGAMHFDHLLCERLMEAMVRRGAHRHPERNAQVLRDFDQFRAVMAGPSLHFLFDLPWTPLYLGILFLIHPLLGAVATAGAVALLALAVVNEARTRPPFAAAAAAALRAASFADAIIRNADVARAMGMTGGLTARWQRDRITMLARQARASDVNADLTALTRFSRLLLQSLMLATGAWLAVDHAILPATIFAASIVMGRSLAPVEQAVTAWRQFGAAGDAALRIRRLLHDQPPARPRTRLDADDVRLAFERVGYAAPGARRPMLRGVGFTLASGEALGVLGPSGAGKTTLGRLAVGVVAPSEGRVRFAGADLAQWDRADRGRLIGYLPDRVGLFAGTVRDNIARFGPATDADVIEAAVRAGVHDMILDLPDGYDTLLTDGARELSGGQRQRIGLARAIVGTPRLVVLDEPNAHLDDDGERALDAAIAALKARGATVLVVTHRPAALALVDKVLVLHDGAVATFGPHGDAVEQLRREIVRPLRAAEA